MTIHEHHLPHGDERESSQHESKIPKELPHHPSHDAKYAGRWIVGVVVLAVAYFAGIAVHEQVQKGRERERDARLLTGGDPWRGRDLLRPYGCVNCHTIPGVRGADGMVGPSLDRIASRIYVGGVVTNTPQNLIRWIMDPKAIDPKTAMPAVGVTEDQARDIAAYLYTLR